MPLNRIYKCKAAKPLRGAAKESKMSGDMKRELEGIKTEMRRGFAMINKRLDAHDNRFESNDKRFDSMDQRFDGMDKRFDRMDKRFDTLEATVRNIAIEQARARGDIEDLKENMVTKSEFRSHTAIVVSHLEAFASQMEAFRRQSIIMGDMLMDHQDRIVRLESRPATA